MDQIHTSNQSVSSPKPDRGVRVWLGFIAALLAANLLVAMNGTPRQAQAAGIPDSGAQLQAVVDELGKVNKSVEKLQAYLESGKLTVNTKPVDKTDR